MSNQTDYSNVKIPPNTMIVPGGKYPKVRKIKPVKERKNKNTKYGEVVGYIIDGRYVTRKEKEIILPFATSFGATILMLSVGLPILFILLESFPLSIAYQIFVLACLKIEHPGLTANNASRYYKESFLSVCFPKVSISKNSITKLFNQVGLNLEGRQKYFEKILKEIKDKYYTLYIDGSHRQLNSNSNTLSKTPYKKKFRGFDVINVLQAYSPLLLDIVCTAVFPGSYSDTSVFRKYLIENNIKKGLLVGDAAFLPSIVAKLIKEFAEFAGLSYIGILKKNSKKIADLKDLNFTHGFESSRGKVLYAKVYDEIEKVWYYVFKNIKMSHIHENTYMEVQYKTLTDGYFKVEYDDLKDSFGKIYTQSNLDLDPKELYQIILDRWCIEVVFHKEKTDLGLDCTRVQGVFSTIGLEFVNTVTTSLYEKVCAKIEPIKGKVSFINFIKNLSGVWLKISDVVRKNVQNNVQWILNEGMPARDDNNWFLGRQEDLDNLEKLNLIKHSSQEDNSDRMQVDDHKDELSDLYESILQNLHERLDNIIKYVGAKFSSLLNNEDTGGNIYSSLAKKIYRQLIRMEKLLSYLEDKVKILSSLAIEDAKSTSVDTQPAKVRKTRSDKGVKRGPYKNRAANSAQNQDLAQANQEENRPQADTETAETIISIDSPAKKARKTRSDKGVKRGSYKNRAANSAQNQDLAQANQGENRPQADTETAESAA